MHTVTSLPYALQEEEHVWIPMPDKTRLSARIWRPVSSDEVPVPAILEFIPYRKRDLTAVRDSINHPYMAGHGYACARVDLRGSGDSEGVLTDEYLEQELVDGETVLAWLAKQPWCNGRTGMMGISWGGFNALQIAARRPPSLEAIITLCSSDNRYADDVHYMGGCLLSDNLSWASTMFAYNSYPPDPAVVGKRWREMWYDRLRHSGLWLEEWLRHQRRDDYWRHGSIDEDYDAIVCPVLAVSGWADGYSNAVFRLLANLKVPRQGLIGPWSHKYPHLGQPGPAIGFLQEAVRWWDHWLKDSDNKMMDEPQLRAWMQDSVPPSTAYEERPGRWVAEPGWPSPGIELSRHPLTRNRIGRANGPSGSGALTIESPLSVGQFAGKWCSYNAPPDLPYDQREEDGGSLVFDGETLDEPLELLGAPVVELVFSVDRPIAMLAARLSDVAPDGQATRVSFGLLNLTHRATSEVPEPLTPGREHFAQVQLNGIAHSFPPGHHLRLSLSTSYWPLAWPPPEPVRLTVHVSDSNLMLPVRPLHVPRRVEPKPFGEPEGTPPLPTAQTFPGEERWQVFRDLVTYRSVLEVIKDLGTVGFGDIDLEVSRRAEESYSCVADDFGSPRGDVTWTTRFARGDWNITTVTHTRLSCDISSFYVHAQLDAFEGDERRFSRNWKVAIPRDHI